MAEADAPLSGLLPWTPPRRPGLTVLDRSAPVDGGQRALQQAILRGFATTGAAPAPDQLAEVIRPYGPELDHVMAQLVAEDYLALDQAGRIRAAYPFSAVPTAHQVRIHGGPRVHAMCAIDALGMPKMLGTDLRIESTDPHTGTPVIVTFTGGTGRWTPDTAVVYSGMCAGVGPAADMCCSYLNFHADHASATAWAAEHPHVTGRILTQAEAVTAGEATFGPVLTAPP